MSGRHFIILQYTAFHQTVLFDCEENFLGKHLSPHACITYNYNNC